MPSIKHHLKRVLTDATGYGLVLLGIAFGWVPGPGGIPLILAGLGLLAINNVWAQRIRDYLLTRGGKLVRLLFPAHPVVEWLYDGLTIIMLIAVGLLAKNHASTWQISLAILLFFGALFFAFMNRGRLDRLRKKS